MTQDKSTKRPWRVEIDGWDAIIIGGIDGEEGNVCGPSHGPDADDATLIVQAVNSHDAMQECVEALKALIAHTRAWERLTAEEAGHEPCLSDPLVDAIAALARLEKANG